MQFGKKEIKERLSTDKKNLNIPLKAPPEDS